MHRTSTRCRLPVSIVVEPGCQGATMHVTVMSASVRLSKVEEASRRFEMAKQMRREAAERRRNKDASGCSSSGLNSNPWLRRTLPAQHAPEPLTVSAPLTVTALLPAQRECSAQRPLSPPAVQPIERPASAQRCDKPAVGTRRVTGSALATLAGPTVLTDGAEGDGDAAPLEPPPLLKSQAVYRCGEIQP